MVDSSLNHWQISKESSSVNSWRVERVEWKESSSISLPKSSTRGGTGLVLCSFNESGVADPNDSVRSYESSGLGGVSIRCFRHLSNDGPGLSMVPPRSWRRARRTCRRVPRLRGRRRITSSTSQSTPRKARGVRFARTRHCLGPSIRDRWASFGRLHLHNFLFFGTKGHRHNSSEPAQLETVQVPNIASAT